MATERHGRFYHLKPLFRKYASYFWFGAVATVFANGLMLITPYLIKLAFEAVEAKRPPSFILTLCLYMIILAVVAGVFRFIMRRSIIWASRKIEYDLRGMLFTKWLGLDPTYYDSTRTGDLMAHATNDIEAVRMLTGPGVMHIFNAAVSIVVGVAFMITLSVKLTLFTIIPMTLLAIALNRLGNFWHKRFLAIQAHFSYLTARVQENLAGVRVIRAYGRQGSEIEHFSGVSQEYARLNLRMMRVYGLLQPLIYAIVGLITLLMLFMGGREVAAGTTSLGTLVAFFAYLGWLVWPMMALGWVISLYQRGVASMDRINKILDTQPKIVDPAPGRHAPRPIRGKIEFRHLTFAYPGADGQRHAAETVLHDVNLTIEPGMRLGIIGPTGSGKTSLVSLIPRLYPTEPGQLFIDDLDITLWPLPPLRRAIGYVPQETFLFSDTLEANITFSLDRDAPGSVADMARLAALHEDVESFPQKYETILGERGITLSGGQKQRTALARAIMKQPAILILDDATSSVDTETEDKILANLEKVMPGRTSIIISHRVASLKDCLLIIYLDHGRIIEQGTHEALIAGAGAYASLYRRQLMEAQLERM
jgi:ATP-binding cassette subfamily B multidrug efflux pump